MQLMLEGKMSIGEIAENVKKSRKTIYNWMNDPDFQEEYKELENDFNRTIKATISHMAKTALHTQENIMKDSNNDIARANVSFDVLDRAGFVKLKYSDISKADADTVEGGIVILADVIDEGGEGNG